MSRSSPLKKRRVSREHAVAMKPDDAEAAGENIQRYLCFKWCTVYSTNVCGQGWICRLPGARENITVCGVAPVPALTHRVS